MIRDIMHVKRARMAQQQKWYIKQTNAYIRYILSLAKHNAPKKNEQIIWRKKMFATINA